MVKYPEIKVRLVGEDGNAFSILGRVLGVMRDNGIKNEWDTFHAEATSDDYNHLLRTVMAWFAVDWVDDDDDNDNEPYAGDDDDDYDDDY